MHAQTPMTLAAAGYDSLQLALRDHNTAWTARKDGDFHHTALAVVTQQPDGGFRIDRADNTAISLTWGDGFLAGALFVLLPGVRFQLLPTLDSIGRRAIARHFHRNIRPDDRVAATGTLEDSRCGLVAVVVNRVSRDVGEQLVHARMTHLVEMVWGDLEEELGRDLVASLALSSDSCAASSTELPPLPKRRARRRLIMPSPGAAGV